MLDVIDRRRQRALKRRRDTSRHLVRWQAGILPDHPDYRDPDVRKDVGRCAHRGEGSDSQEKQGEHDKGIRPAQGNSDEGVHLVASQSNQK